MPFYKDQNNKVHFLDSAEHAALLPSDSMEITEANAKALTAPSADDVRRQYEAAAQRALDAVAQSWGYDDLRSAVSYIGSKVTKWDAEGRALRDYRDDFWAAANSIEVSVEHGSPMPGSIDEFIALLPPEPSRPQ